MIENYIQITKLNDMLYSATSIYLHCSYEDKEINIYKQKSQLEGSKNHKNIDMGKYSSRKDIISGLTVYSEILGLVGKIDIYDNRYKKLIERKTHIKKIHRGYIIQLYCQYYAMLEMGYEINTLSLYSIKDNKIHNIKLPTIESFDFITKLIQKIKNTKEEDIIKKYNNKMASYSIYGALSW